jgi:SM-20-related protein
VFEAVAAGIAERRWCAIPSFLDAGSWQALAAHARSLARAGELRPAGVGQGADFALRPDVRGDWIRWLDVVAAGPELAAYLARMEELRVALNRDAYLGLLELEAHLALYPPGAGYARHSDRFARDPRRALSSVLYLNEAWERGDGGTLRLHLGARDHADIEPQGGTLVLFASDLEHEVLPARRERLSVAGWFKVRGRS